MRSGGRVDGAAGAGRGICEWSEKGRWGLREGRKRTRQDKHRRAGAGRTDETIENAIDGTRMQKEAHAQQPSVGLHLPFGPP
eukprot:604376-Pleurochrysis_carterae.AAC.3